MNKRRRRRRRNKEKEREKQEEEEKEQEKCCQAMHQNQGGVITKMATAVDKMDAAMV